MGPRRPRGQTLTAFSALSFLLSWAFFYLHPSKLERKATLSCQESSLVFLQTSRDSRISNTFPQGSGYLHLTQQGVVTGVGGEVLLKNRHRARQGHMPAATEQGDPGEAEDGGHQGGVGDPSQTLDAAFKAAWTQRRENAAVTGKTSLSASTAHLCREGRPLPSPLARSVVNSSACQGPVGWLSSAHILGGGPRGSKRGT